MYKIIDGKIFLLRDGSLRNLLSSFWRLYLPPDRQLTTVASQKRESLYSPPLEPPASSMCVYLSLTERIKSKIRSVELN